MGSGLERCSVPTYGEECASQRGGGLCRRNREDIWLHMCTCFAQCAVSHHSQLNASGTLLQMSSYFLSSLLHFSLAPAHIPFCSQELQGWPVSSSDRWWISPCAGSVSWSNAPFGRKITGSAYFLGQCLHQSCSPLWLYLGLSMWSTL